MNSVSASLKGQLYKTEIKSVTNSIIADEPVDLGGQDLGFNPNELLAASLSACTCITLKMYAERKGWNLEDVHVMVDFERDSSQNKSVIKRKITLSGNLDEMQRARLIQIANQCPIHKTLTNPIEIITETN